MTEVLWFVGGWLAGWFFIAWMLVWASRPRNRQRLLGYYMRQAMKSKSKTGRLPPPPESL